MSSQQQRKARTTKVIVFGTLLFSLFTTWHGTKLLDYSSFQRQQQQQQHQQHPQELRLPTFQFHALNNKHQTTLLRLAAQMTTDAYDNEIHKAVNDFVARYPRRCMGKKYYLRLVLLLQQSFSTQGGKNRPAAASALREKLCDDVSMLHQIDLPDAAATPDTSKIWKGNSSNTFTTSNRTKTASLSAPISPSSLLTNITLN